MSRADLVEDGETWREERTRSGARRAGGGRRRAACRARPDRGLVERLTQAISEYRIVDLARHLVQPLAHPFAQLGRGLLGKGDRGHRCHRDAGEHQRDHPSGEHRGLPGTGASLDEQRRLQGVDDALTRGAVVELSLNHRQHPPPRRSPRRPAVLRRAARTPAGEGHVACATTRGGGRRCPVRRDRSRCTARGASTVVAPVEAGTGRRRMCWRSPPASRRTPARSRRRAGSRSARPARGVKHVVGADLLARRPRAAAAAAAYTGSCSCSPSSPSWPFR